MKLLAALIFAALSLAPAAAPAGDVYIVRHLQKGEGADPSLTAEGAANAQRLAAMLADKGIVAIFVTQTRRAMETAQPLAKQLGIAITPYDPRKPDALIEAATAISGPILVVGHSNTVPDLVASFGGPRPEPMSEADYGTLFIVETKGKVAATELR